jgi:hypothetical protein
VVDPLSIAIEGARCLARLVDHRGKFLYRYDADNSGPLKGYNILRHCGAIWAMAEVANRAGPLPDVLKAADRAADWLIAKHIAPYHATGTSCVVARDNVKLGGNGLAVLALLELATATGRDDRIILARNLAGYVLLQQRPDGDFVHKRKLSTDEVLPFRSDYYTGEALFGLLRLSRLTGESRWLDACETSERLLALQDYGVAQQSHWMLYALEQLHVLRPLPLYRTHALKIAEDIIQSPAYRAEYRSTPIACRSEGLLCFVRLCTGIATDVADRPLFDRAAAESRATVHDNLSLQLAYRRPDGSFIHGRDRSLVQIDYIQHNISSFLGYGLLTAASRELSAAAVVNARSDRERGGPVAR